VTNADGSWSVSGRWETTDTVPITNSFPASTGLPGTFAGAFDSAVVGSDIPLYFNVHTVRFPTGEIRGQLVAIADDIDNVQTGTTEDDVLHGLGGNDAILGLTGDDTVNGGNGNDVVDGGGGNDRLMGGGGNDMLFGSVGIDILMGGKGDDSMEGGSGIDFLHGGGGDDRLDGGAGIDFLHGGKGADVYAFASPGDGPDVIVGFRSGTDTIEIDVDDPATVTFLGFEDSTDTGPAVGPALTYSDRTGELHWDPTGGAANDQILVAKLLSSPELVTTDMLLI
jgi:Ca2+-binding RTX toxin-like protein